MVLRRVPVVLLSAFAVFGCSWLSPAPSKYEPTPLETEWEQCSALEDANEIDEADECFLQMCEREPPYARACYDRSRMFFEFGKLEAARKTTTDFIERFPNDALAPTAAKRLGASYADTMELEQGFHIFKSLAEKTRETEVYDSVLFAHAKLLGQAGRPADEAAMLERLANEHGRWDSQLWDNAMWRLISIYEELGDMQSEKSTLERLLKARERSYLIGSYNSPYYDDALLKMGYIALKNGDFSAARGFFRKLAADEKSRLRDDGFLGEAEVEIALDNPAKACGIVKQVMEMAGASRAKKARKMFESLECSSYF